MFLVVLVKVIFIIYYRIEKFIDFFSGELGVERVGNC